ncbi:MAG: lecithin retinol acyltransferase family protein [Thermomicrobiales bacterium]
MKACVRHWKIHYGGFWHHFLDFRRLPIARLHWGYESIVELVRQPEAIVKRNTWEGVIDAAGGAQPVLVREIKHGLEDVFDRAKGKLLWQHYNLVFYNCEHFANECMTGVRRSRQVRQRSMQAFTSVFSGLTGVSLIQFNELSTSMASLALFSGLLSVLCGAAVLNFVIRSTMSMHRLERRKASKIQREESIVNHAVV